MQLFSKEYDAHEAVGGDGAAASAGRGERGGGGAFKAFDKDGSGEIDGKEPGADRRARPPLVGRRRKEALDLLDGDGDGTVSPPNSTSGGRTASPRGAARPEAAAEKDASSASSARRRRIGSSGRRASMRGVHEKLRDPTLLAQKSREQLAGSTGLLQQARDARDNKAHRCFLGEGNSTAR